MRFHPWEAARAKCASGPQPGAVALLARLLEVHGRDGCRSLGIYNCRSVRGSTTPSMHGEGRALDLQVPMRNGRGSALGHSIVDRIVSAAGPLGVQAVVYDRRIWSAKSPSGRAYTGAAPHYDHVHVELTRRAGDRLTLTTCRAHYGGASVPDDYEAPVNAAPGSRTVTLGSAGTDVEYLQRFLRVAADGYMGPGTVAALTRWQASRGLDADGVAGPATWRAVLAPTTKENPLSNLDADDVRALTGAFRTALDGALDAALADLPQRVARELLAAPLGGYPSAPGDVATALTRMTTELQRLNDQEPDKAQVVASAAALICHVIAGDQGRTTQQESELAAAVARIDARDVKRPWEGEQ